MTRSFSGIILTAATLLCATSALANPDAPPTRYLVEPKLVVRQSSGPPK